MASSIQQVALEGERAELERVLQSDMFVRAPALSHLLSYVCEKAFHGEAQQIKEYSIAVDVFGRQPSFDHESDSIVRVQANRLRKHLATYYAGEGVDHPIHISIPVGQYTPLFEPHSIRSDEKPPSTTTAAPPSGRKSLWVIIAAIALLFVAALAILATSHKPRVANIPSEPSLPPAVSGPVGPPAGDEVRILAGSDKEYVDRSGKRWDADRFFTSGMAVRTPLQHVSRTLDPDLYRHARQGEFSYDIPLKPGIYELRLHFVEAEYGPENHLGGGEGSRLMAVTANGKQLLNGLDVVADAGGSRIADVKVFSDISPASDGQLHVKISSLHGGRGMLSAIEILPGLKGHQRPVRLVMRDSSYYSNDSRWWSPDNYFSGGQLASHIDSATGTDDPELYEGERWGRFSYDIPAVPGSYTVILHFVERRFGASNRDNSEGSPAPEPGGSRVFNVFCNEKPLLKDFEILKEAQPGQPLAKKFTGLEPNAQGKLTIEFIPIRNYATISAIEVLPE